MSKPTLEELCKGLKESYPAAITDILEEYGLRKQWLGADIQPLAPTMRAAGPAFTMRWVNDPVPLTEQEKRYIGKLMDDMKPLMIPVIDTGKAPDSGYWGELMCTLCLEKGIDGAVIDGGVRDPDYILKLGIFNIFQAFICPNEANTRSRLESYQKPIFINGVRIRPGDFIVAEIGGVVVIPHEIVYEVYEKAQAKIDEESEKRRMIREGYTYDEILDKLGGGL